jgi:hypothetical protein
VIVLITKAVFTSETSVNYLTARQYIPEDSELHNLIYFNHYSKLGYILMTLKIFKVDNGDILYYMQWNKFEQQCVVHTVQ